MACESTIKGKRFDDFAVLRDWEKALSHLDATTANEISLGILEELNTMVHRAFPIIDALIRTENRRISDDEQRELLGTLAREGFPQTGDVHRLRDARHRSEMVDVRGMLINHRDEIKKLKAELDIVKGWYDPHRV